MTRTISEDNNIWLRKLCAMADTRTELIGLLLWPDIRYRSAVRNVLPELNHKWNLDNISKGLGFNVDTGLVANKVLIALLKLDVKYHYGEIDEMVISETTTTANDITRDMVELREFNLPTGLKPAHYLYVERLCSGKTDIWKEDLHSCLKSIDFNYTNCTDSLQLNTLLSKFNSPAVNNTDDIWSVLEILPVLYELGTVTNVRSTPILTQQIIDKGYVVYLYSRGGLEAGPQQDLDSKYADVGLRMGECEGELYAIDKLEMDKVYVFPGEDDEKFILSTHGLTPRVFLNVLGSCAFTMWSLLPDQKVRLSDMRHNIEQQSIHNKMSTVWNRMCVLLTRNGHFSNGFRSKMKNACACALDEYEERIQPIFPDIDREPEETQSRLKRGILCFSKACTNGLANGDFLLPYTRANNLCRDFDLTVCNVMVGRTSPSTQINVNKRCGVTRSTDPPPPTTRENANNGDGNEKAAVPQSATRPPMFSSRINKKGDAGSGNTGDKRQGVWVTMAILVAVTLSMVIAFVYYYNFILKKKQSV